MPLLEEQTLQNGRYTVIRKLGEGGMRSTYLVHDQTLDRECAIKVISEHVLHEAGLRQFLREAQVLARLHHPNLPIVYDYSVEQDQPYIIMEYIEGRNLQTYYVDQGHPSEVEVVLEWATNLLSALHYLHSQSPPVIHRDIKPSNVCITPEGKAVLLDFGIARQLSDTSTHTGAQAHSLSYSPIEQYPAETMGSYGTLQQYLEELKAAGVRTDPYSDVYSLGATLYFALTSRDPVDSCLRVLGEALLPILDVNPDVPPLLVDTITIAMKVDPKERFQSIAEMIAHLQPLLAGGSAAVSQVAQPIVEPLRPRRFMVEDRPADLVRRPAEFEALKAHLLSETLDEAVAVTAALRGAGGYGKTTLARDLCHDPEIWQAFPDGILWVTMGEEPNLYDNLRLLYAELTDQRPGPAFVNEQDAANHLAQAWGDRRCLLVIDDVWHETDLRPFLRGGPYCVRLITTRNRDTLPRDVRQVDVDAMEADEAVALLGTGLTDKVRIAYAESLRGLAARLGGWPLLLKLANGVMLDRLRCGQTVSEALAYVRRALDRRGATAFDVWDARSRQEAVASTLGASFDLLREDEYARYSELAVFPKDVDLPLSVVEKLWAATGGLDNLATEDLCLLLDRLSLLLNLDLYSRTLRLHDVIHGYLSARLSDQLPALHVRLLDAYRPVVASTLLPDSSASMFTWADLPSDEPYLWDTLAYHLRGAGRGDELVATVKDLRYLAAKTYARSAYAAELDLLEAERLAQEGKGQEKQADLHSLSHAFAQSSHLLDKCETHNDVKATLYSRLHHLDGLDSALQQLAQSLEQPYLVPWCPLPDLPHPALWRTLSGHTNWVIGCAISQDGNVVVSESQDGTLKVWDVRNGTERLTIPGSASGGKPKGSCAVNANGTVIVGSNADGDFSVWEIAENDTVAELLSIPGTGTRSDHCAISADGKVVVFAIKNTITIWHRELQSEAWVLSEHTCPAVGCGTSADGAVVAAAFEDGITRIWDLRSDSSCIVRSDCCSLNGCAISANGESVALWSWGPLPFPRANRVQQMMIESHNAWKGRKIPVMGLFEVWDARSGTRTQQWLGHTDVVTDCRLAAMGKTLVTASKDKTVRVWDAQRGTELSVLTGHTHWVNNCDVSEDGKIIVSASADYTLKVWNLAYDRADWTPSEHTGRMFDCAIAPDGKVIVSTLEEAAIKIWNAGEWTSPLRIAEHQDKVFGCAISADGKTVVSASQDRELHVISLDQFEYKSLIGHEDAVCACALSADNTFVVSASGDETLKIWDIETGLATHTLKGHKDAVRGCAIGAHSRPRGRRRQRKRQKKAVRRHAISADQELIVSASDDGTLKVWDARTGELRRTLIGHEVGRTRCAVSADGKTIISSSHDLTLKVWETEIGKARLTLRGHTGSVLGCAISSDGDIVVSASDDKSLKVWSARDGECLATMYVESSLYSCACSADGRYIVAVGEGGIYFLQFVR